MKTDMMMKNASHRHRITSSAYRTSQKTSNNNGDSPNTQGLKAREAYKKAAAEFDASH